MSKHIAEQFTMPFEASTAKLEYAVVETRKVVHIRCLTRRQALCGWPSRKWKNLDHNAEPGTYRFCKQCEHIAKRAGFLNE